MGCQNVKYYFHFLVFNLCSIFFKIVFLILVICICLLQVAAIPTRATCSSGGTPAAARGFVERLLN